MATGFWEGLRVPASARASLALDGTLEIATATADIGTGTYTILTQIGAEMLGLPLDKVKVKIGDSDLPPAPVEGASWTTASVGSAVMALRLRPQGSAQARCQDQQWPAQRRGACRCDFRR